MRWEKDETRVLQGINVKLKINALEGKPNINTKVLKLLSLSSFFRSFLLARPSFHCFSKTAKVIHGWIVDYTECLLEFVLNVDLQMTSARKLSRREKKPRKGKRRRKEKKGKEKKNEKKRDGKGEEKKRRMKVSSS